MFAHPSLTIRGVVGNVLGIDGWMSLPLWFVLEGMISTESATVSQRAWAPKAMRVFVM